MTGESTALEEEVGELLLFFYLSGKIPQIPAHFLEDW